jgi:HEAT repeat protein
MVSRRGVGKEAWILILLFSFAVGCSEPSEAEIKQTIKNMRSPDASVRNQAALAAADFGKAGPKAVPELIHLLSDENNGVRSGAAYALRRIDTPEARRALDQAESDK